MPYVKCPHCKAPSYSAAAHAVIEECPVCGATLPRGRRAAGRSGPMPMEAAREAAKPADSAAGKPPPARASPRRFGR
jgi:endogenous inhibitor of DNA gyrase (YacG/DUF329 family)